MSPNDQCIAIAQACGKNLTAYRFQHHSYGRPETLQWSPAYSTREEARHVSDNEEQRWSSKVWPVEKFTNPDDALPYLTGLDAMAEAEKMLTDDQWDDYRERLEGLDWRHVNATAAQRAEAFLRAKGLWHDSP